MLFFDQIHGNTRYNSSKSGFGSTSGSCGSRYSIHWSSRLCAVLLITGVSAFKLLMMFLLHVTVFRYVSRYILYRDLCIEIRIVSWGTLFVTPLLFTSWIVSIIFIYQFALCIITLHCNMAGSCRSLSRKTQTDIWIITSLTRWGGDKMAAISQTTFSSTFPWLKIVTKISLKYVP